MPPFENIDANNESDARMDRFAKRLVAYGSGGVIGLVTAMTLNLVFKSNEYNDLAVVSAYGAVGSAAVDAAVYGLIGWPARMTRRHERQSLSDIAYMSYVQRREDAIALGYHPPTPPTNPG